MSDLTAALLARRSELHATIRHHASEIADIDRLLVRHDHEFQPTITLFATHIALDDVDDLANSATTIPVTAAHRAGLMSAIQMAAQHDDRPPADVPHVEPAPVAEAGVEPAPDGLPRPSLDTPAPRKRRRRTSTGPSPDPTAPGAALVDAAARTKITPYLECKHPGCGRTFATRQSLGGHMARGHRDAPTASPTDKTPQPDPAPQPPAVKPSGAQGPVGMPAERGRVLRCSCGWQTSPSHARDLTKHTVIEHHREPTRDERTPILDERAA